MTSLEGCVLTMTENGNDLNCDPCSAGVVTDPTSNGDQNVCEGENPPVLSVEVPANLGVNWYSTANGGQLLQAGSTEFNPTQPGTYFAEAYDLSNESCLSESRYGRGI